MLILLGYLIAIMLYCYHVNLTMCTYVISLMIVTVLIFIFSLDVDNFHTPTCTVINILMLAQ